MKRKTSASPTLIRCPHCGAPLSQKFVRRAAGRSVGAITGTRKAHSSEKARAAVMVRWAKARGQGS